MTQAERVQIWNSGGGMQSTAIAVLIVTGRLPVPDLAVISDTGRERTSTWEYLARWVMPALRDAGVVLHRISKDQFTSIDLYGGKDRSTLLIPAFTTQNGDVGKLRAFCSAEWKRDVIRRWARREHGVRLATNWIGYSVDEIGRAERASRAKKNSGKWQVSFPLIELGMTRADCVALVKRMGWPTPPRSSCWMCPNMRVDEWRDVKSDPRDWQAVVQFDRELRSQDPSVWLTPQAVPIAQADFNDANEVMFGRERGGCNSGLCMV